MRAVVLLLLLALTACNPGGAEPITLPVTPPVTENPENPENPETPQVGNDVKITIGNQMFSAVLADNATAEAFAKMLPLTADMSDFNDNEKLFYLSENLPTEASSVRRIEAGDLMLYGSTCVVLFYEAFSSPYSYTRIGRIENATGLAAAVGAGNVKVKFEITK